MCELDKAMGCRGIRVFTCITGLYVVSHVLAQDGSRHLDVPEVDCRGTQWLMYEFGGVLLRLFLLSFSNKGPFLS